MKTISLACLLLATVFTYAQSNLTTKLQACYDLDCPTGSITTNGASTGAALDGTVHGNVTCVAGHVGTPSTALQFGGTPLDYVALPSNPLIRPTGSITIAGWFYVTNTSYETLVFTKNNCASIQPGYSTSSNNGKFALTKYPNGCGTGSTVISATSSMNAWHHVVAYADNSRLSIIVDNGTPVTLTHTLTFSYGTNEQVILGGTNDSYNFPYTGRMDNLRFYNRELTSGEIATLYSLDPYCTDEGVAPVTGFDMSETSICDMRSITFTDQSTNTPIAWNWQFQGGSPATSSLNTPTVNYSAPGVYTVSLLATNNYGVGTTVTKTVTVTTCVGLARYADQEQRPQLFPNPAAGRFTIDRVSDCDVSISDVSGRLIEMVRSNSDRTEIDCSHQPPGVYSVCVRHRNTGAVTVLKLVLYGN